VRSASLLLEQQGEGRRLGMAFNGKAESWGRGISNLGWRARLLAAAAILVVIWAPIVLVTD
jgi:hypothetical protein